MTPWLAGLTPFGLVIGVSAAQAHIPTPAGWLSGPLIFAGSADVATIQMLDGGAAASAVVLTTLVINLRLIVYSAAMAKHWRGTPLALAALAVSGLASNVPAGGACRAITPIAAATVGALAVARTGRPYAAMLAGMPTLWILTALIPT